LDTSISPSNIYKVEKMQYMHEICLSEEKSYYPDEIADVASAERGWAGHAEPAVSWQSIVGAMPLWPGTQQRVLSTAFSLSLSATH
jgi:hypothetical protein